MIKKSTQQKTLAKSVRLDGIGLHSGQKVELNLKPAPPNSGFVFLRTDLDPSVEIPATSNFVSKTDRGTTLEKDGVEIQTCEHLLAALVGMSVNNCLIEINRTEIPIMDGSSKYFIEAIKSAGLEEQNEKQEVFVVEEIIKISDEETGSEIMLLPSEETSYTVMIDFNTKVLGSQNATLDKIENFSDEIASSRTFSFLHELEMLLEHGLIKGGDLNNAIIYVDKPIAESNMDRLKKAFQKEEITVKSNGILDNLTLHHPNEAARHKLLDVVGDLALIGMPFKGRL